MVGREVGKNVLASELGRACVKALSQKGKGEFEGGKCQRRPRGSD